MGSFLVDNHYAERIEALEAENQNLRIELAQVISGPPEPPPLEPLKTPVPQCETCRFWAADDDSRRTGTCQRYAPRPGETAHWPAVPYYEFCGDFQPLAVRQRRDGK